MRYLLKDRISFPSVLPSCALIFSILIIVLSQYDNNILLSSPSSPPISKIVQAAAAISPSPSYSHFDFNTATTITNIQLPGIIPNNNPPASPSSNP